MAVPFGSLAVSMIDSRAKAVVKNIMQVTPITDYLSVEDTNGSFTHFWNRDVTIPAVTYTGLNQSAPTPSNGGQRRFTATASRMDAKLRIDEAMRKAPTLWESEEAKQLRLAGISIGLELTSVFFNGDQILTPLQPAGIKQLLDLGIADGTLPSQQKIDASAAAATAHGTALTLAMLDQLIDAVVGDNKVLFVNRFMRRKILALMRDSSSSGFYRIDISQDKFGRAIEMYGSIPIRVVERMDTYSTPLDFTETDGNASPNLDTCSIYCCNFDSAMGVYSFATDGLGVQVDPFVKVPGEHYYDSLSSMIFGFIIAGVRSCARLYHVKQA